MNTNLPAIPQPATATTPSDFGHHVTTRKPTWLNWTALILPLILASFGSGIIEQGVNDPRKGISSILIGVLMAVAAVAAVWYIIRHMRTRHEFYERGVQVHRGKAFVREMAYADVRKFELATVRQYVNGIYAGTSLRMRIEDANRCVIRFSGSHKEKATFLGGTLLNQRFKGEDELDVVRMMIAEQMLPALSQQLASNGSVVWCNRHVLSATGITPSNGTRKRTLVPYQSIFGFAVQAGLYHVFVEGDKKSFISIPINSENFWPGLMLFEQLMAQYHQPAPHAEEAPTEALAASA